MREIVGKGSVQSYSSAVIAATAGATTDVIAAPGAGKFIRVLGYHGTADIAGSIKWLDSTPTAKTGVMPVGATGGFVVPVTDWDTGLFDCATNTKLQLTTVSCTFNGVVEYCIVSVVS